MSPRLHRHFHIARRTLWYGLVATLAFMALAFGVASQLLPLAERHPERIAAFLGKRVHRPVAFDRVETQWTRRGPRWAGAVLFGRPRTGATLTPR